MPTGAKILVVDDDPRICRLLARYLSQEGYQVSTACSGKAMRQMLPEVRPRLVILDLMLPDEDGFGLARELRARSNLAIVILSGKANPVDKIVGLELGADDYITKPFDERELLARVRSVLRRVPPEDQERTEDTGAVACFAGWLFDLCGYELTSPAGEHVGLTSHECQLLAALVKHSHRVLSREAILDAVTGRDWSPYDRSVDVLVGKLRRKIEPDPKHPRLIKTVRGAGYKLAVPVEFR